MLRLRSETLGHPFDSDLFRDVLEQRRRVKNCSKTYTLQSDQISQPTELIFSLTLASIDLRNSQILCQAARFTGGNAVNNRICPRPEQSSSAQEVLVVAAEPLGQEQRRRLLEVSELPEPNSC